MSAIFRFAEHRETTYVIITTFNTANTITVIKSYAHCTRMNIPCIQPSTYNNEANMEISYQIEIDVE